MQNNFSLWSLRSVPIMIECCKPDFDISHGLENIEGLRTNGPSGINTRWTTKNYFKKSLIEI